MSTFSSSFSEVKVIQKNYNCKTYCYNDRGGLEDFLFKEKRSEWEANTRLRGKLTFGNYIIGYNDPNYITRLPVRNIYLPGIIADIGYGTIQQIKDFTFKSRANTHQNDLVWTQLKKNEDMYSVFLLTTNCPQDECEALEAYFLDWSKYGIKLIYTGNEIKAGEIYNKKQQPTAFKTVSNYLNLEKFDYDCNEKRQKQTGIQLF